MKIVVGSHNRAKRQAVQWAFPEARVISHHADSKISSQPFSDAETRRGAINRAKSAAKVANDAIGIGLEGGIMRLDEKVYLCSWGALVDCEGRVITASGGRIVLPGNIVERLNQGVELGDVMDEFTNQTDIRHKTGAVGIFTNDLVSREALFAHVVKLLNGQWQYIKKNSNLK